MPQHCTVSQPQLPFILEEWRAIPGYETHYEASNLGRIRRIAPGPGVTVGRVLQPHLTAHGYHHVGLHCGSGHHKGFHVHTLIALTFIRPHPPNTQVNHKDGNKLNNLLDNLEWVTAQQNIRHSYQHRLQGKRLVEHFAKLTPKQVLEIRQRKAPKATLIIQYGVTRRTIERIWTNRTWRELAPIPE